THDGVRFGSGDAAKETKLSAAHATLYCVDATSDGGRIFAGADDDVVFSWDKGGKLSRIESPPPNIAQESGSPAKAATIPPPSFKNDILPILSKAGCNSGACHAKATGQAGLKFSIFAFDPKSDYNALVKADRGRRVFPALPEESLILKKPSAAIAHEGGQRIEPDSASFATIAEWIRRGAPTKMPANPNSPASPFHRGKYSSKSARNKPSRTLRDSTTVRPAT
ncbi:MAG TPA: hypothetical protein VGH65_10240, partial [Verrucomicrobiaceae bacterium]